MLNLSIEFKTKEVNKIFQYSIEIEVGIATNIPTLLPVGAFKNTMVELSKCEIIYTQITLLFLAGNSQLVATKPWTKSFYRYDTF